MKPGMKRATEIPSGLLISLISSFCCFWSPEEGVTGSGVKVKRLDGCRRRWGGWCFTPREDTASLAETTTFPAAPQPPPGKQIRPEEEVSFGSTNRILTHKGEGSMRILPVVSTYPSSDLHVITHTLTHAPTRSSSKVGSCQSINSDFSLFSSPFCFKVKQQGKSVKDSDAVEVSQRDRNISWMSIDRKR